MTSQQLIKLKLPDAPGVYTFVDSKGRPIYIGRATSLRDRTRSYFSADLIETRGPRIVDMITRAKTVKWQQTDSVLEAIILESNLIKKYQPHYNVAEKDDKSSQYVIITDEVWPRVFLVRARDFDAAQSEGNLGYEVKACFGPYPHGGLIKEALKILRKLFPFKDKKALDPRHEAFYRSIGQSPHDGDDNARRRYQRTIDNLMLFFEGKKDLISRRLKKDMDLAARELRFEDAHGYKRTLYALEHINDIALIKSDSDRPHGQVSGFRIEAYDIAHLSGTNVVGAFTVSVDGEFVPAEYRTFNLSRETNDDVRNLMEIINRRLNHPEWQYPDLVVVDGNEVQRSRAEAVFKMRRVSVPVVAVTKDDHHKAAQVIGDSSIVSKHAKNIVAINAEAHRFVIGRHRMRRRRVAFPA